MLHNFTFFKIIAKIQQKPNNKFHKGNYLSKINTYKKNKLFISIIILNNLVIPIEIIIFAAKIKTN